MELTQALAQGALIYDVDTGIFKWRVKPSKNRCAGDVAGCRKPDGYVTITVLGVTCYAHRLAWLYVHGHWPTGDVDHMDGDPSNNRICNLRDVSRRTNMENQKRAQASNRSSGLLGVSCPKGSKSFIAHIHIYGKHRYLGSYATAELAHAAYLHAKRINHQGNML